MTSPAHQSDPCPEEMRILVFTVQDVRMGVDTSQIEELLEVGEAETRRLPIRPIHETVSFGTRTVTYQVPKVITPRDHRSSLAALIDRPDTIAEVKIDSIQALPPLIAARPGASPSIWGAIVRDEEIILLLDFLKQPLPISSAPEGDPRLGSFYRTREEL